METLRASYLYHLWTVLLITVQDSAIYRWLNRVMHWCLGQARGSWLINLLWRESAISRSWPDSGLCRLLTWLFDLPARLLHRLYTALRPTWEDSVFARLAFRMGDETAIAQFWCIALMWVIPYERWNNAYSLLLFAALLVLFHVGAMHRRSMRLDLVHIGFYPLLLFAAMVLAVLLSYVPSESFRFLLYYLSAALCVLVTVSAVRTEDDLKRLAAGGAVCVAGSGAYGIVQRIQGLEVNLSYVDISINEGMPGRVYSFYDNPNAFAQVLVLLLPLVLALMLCAKHWFNKLLAAGIFAIGVTALGMTYSRSNWVGIACAMVVMVLLWKPRMIPVFLLLCCAAIPFLPDTIWNRILTITNTSDKSTASRLPLFQAALDVIAQRPITGAGLGTAAARQYIVDHNLYQSHAPFVHAHNFFLQVWMELGLLGIISFVASLFWGVKQAARAIYGCGSSGARTITCGAAAAICGILVSGLMDYPWNYPRVMCIFWFVFAVLLAGTKLCQKKT